MDNNKEIEMIRKSIRKAFEKIRKKDAVKDLFDNDNISEVSDDEETPGKTSVLKKKKDEECACKIEKDCECDKGGPMDKNEEIARSIINSFAKASELYLAKKECMEKARVDEGMRATDKKKFRAERNEGFTPKTKEKFTADGARQMPKPVDPKIKLQEKYGKKPSQEDLEYPMAANEEKDMEKGKKSKKPFHGYNKEKHSKKGGLSAKAREKYNRENNSNLKAPVSLKEAKKSPKKAGRRKSFCARMSGVKGPTSKEGKLTPKGAALKRWDC